MIRALADARADVKRQCVRERVRVYTDGSHIKGTFKMGIGIYVETDSNRAGGLSRFVSREDMEKEVVGVPAETLAAGPAPSNPTLELYAAILAARWIKKNLSKFESVTMCADYDGVFKYANGVWAASRASPKTPVFAQLALKWETLVKEIRTTRALAVMHIRGHSGVLGNEVADQLAKRQYDFDLLDRIWEEEGGAKTGESAKDSRILDDLIADLRKKYKN